MAESDAVSTKELKRRDFIINGNLWKVVFVIAFPLFIYTIFNYLYSIIDTVMCSDISKAAVNAVGALSQVTNLIAAIGGGLGTGGSILIAREIGRRDYKRAQEYASTLLVYILLFAFLTCVLIIPLTEPLLRLCNISEESIQVGKGYFMISVATSAIMMVNTVYLGIEKAKGSTLFITLLNVAVVLLKVGINALFLYSFNLRDMTFVSLSTLIANACLFIFVLIRFSMKGYLFHFSFRKVDYSSRTRKRLFGISFPITLGKAIFSLGKVVINAFAGNYTADVVGALGISNNMGGAVTNPLSSIEDSSSSIIAQNLGAHRLDRAIKTFWIGLIYAVSIAALGVGIISIPSVDSAICNFFARKAGDDVAIALYAQHIHDVFFYEKMGIITLALNSAVLGMLYGFGYTKLSMIINIARVFVFRIPSFLVAQAILGNSEEAGYKVAGISMGFSNIAIGIVAIISGMVVLSRIKKREKTKEEAKTLTDKEKTEIDAYIHSYLSNYTHYKENGAWCYEDGVVLLGAYRLYKATRQKEYLDFCIHYFDQNIAEDGFLSHFDSQAYSLDDLQPGVALTMIQRLHHEEKYAKALRLLESQFEKLPRTGDGSFFHKGKYANQVWLDGLYMGEPFYVLSAQKRYSLKMKEDVIKQFKNVEIHCESQSDSLFYHAYDASKTASWCDKTTGRSPNVWLRSVGWLSMAECDCISFFEQENDVLFAQKLKPLLKKTLSSLKPYEDPSTHLYKDLPAIEDSRNYLETSGSVMLAYSYMRGARENMLPYGEIKDGIAIFEGVVQTSLKDGRLQNIVQVSGLDDKGRDGSVDYYLSEKVVSDDAKGVGPFMMAYAEYLTLSY